MVTTEPAQEAFNANLWLIGFALLVGVFAGVTADQSWEIAAGQPADGKLETAEYFQERVPRLVGIVILTSLLCLVTTLFPRIVSFLVIGALLGAVLAYGASNIFVHATRPAPVMRDQWQLEMQRLLPSALAAGSSAGTVIAILVNTLQSRRARATKRPAGS